MTTPKRIKATELEVLAQKPGAQRLLINKCVDPLDYEKAILAIKKQCPVIGKSLYLTSGFQTQWVKITRGKTEVTTNRRLVERCAQAEYFAPGKPYMKLNKAVKSCLDRSVVSRSVSDITDGKRVLGALKKAVDDSIPGTWELYKEYFLWGAGTLFTFFLFGKHAIDAWFGRGGPKNPITGNGKKKGSEKKDGPKDDNVSKMVAAALGMLTGLAKKLDDIDVPPVPAPPIWIVPRHPVDKFPIWDPMDPDIVQFEFSKDPYEIGEEVILVPAAFAAALALFGIVVGGYYAAPYLAPAAASPGGRQFIARAPQYATAAAAFLVTVGSDLGMGEAPDADTAIEENLSNIDVSEYAVHDTEMY